MATSTKKILTVTVTPKSGDTVTLVSPQSNEFIRQLEAEKTVIKVMDADASSFDYFVTNCICHVKAVYSNGDEYVKPDCDDLYCATEDTSEDTPEL